MEAACLTLRESLRRDATKETQALQTDELHKDDQATQTAWPKEMTISRATHATLEGKGARQDSCVQTKEFVNHSHYLVDREILDVTNPDIDDRSEHQTSYLTVTVMAESGRGSQAGGQGGQLESGDGAGVGQPAAPEAAAKESAEAQAPESREESRSKLMEAAEDWDMEEVIALVAAGADVGARGECETTALHWAAESGHLEAVKRLLGAGAEVDARDNRQVTPLHLAAYEGHTPVVRLLLGASADPNARDALGRTPLHDAAREGHLDVATALLEAGANSGVRDPKEDKPPGYRQRAK
ncbi:ankyrin repeat domain-containing protein 65-like [Schistocerca americana]|uniref:ankyrin repeat domain-containing protein 65-like n=1 Tax=Schistocerca americana TaxID=7009 RepID=UPI001F4F6A4E|nr:ankyrin repeat domain-containing protein 65-like [Schistocerca americana]